MKRFLLIMGLVVATGTIAAMQENEKNLCVGVLHVRGQIQTRIEAIQKKLQEKNNVKASKALSDVTEVYNQINNTRNKFISYEVCRLLDNHTADIEELVGIQKKSLEIKSTMKLPRSLGLERKILRVKLPDNWQYKRAEMPPLSLDPLHNVSEEPDDDTSHLSTKLKEGSIDLGKKRNSKDMSECKKNNQKNKDIFTPCLLLRFLGGGAVAVGVTGAILYYFLVYKDKHNQQGDAEPVHHATGN